MTEQLAFGFAELDPAPPRHRQFKDWRRLSPPGDKMRATWFHAATGWTVHHCGHPTANWPFYAINPNGETVVAWNGLGFKDARTAFIALAAAGFTSEHPKLWQSQDRQPIEAHR